MITMIELAICGEGGTFSKMGGLYESSSSPPGRSEVSISFAGWC